MTGATPLPGYGLSGSFRFHEESLFSDIRLELDRGAWTCLLGPSGVGKSTLLRVLAGLDTGGEFHGQLSFPDGDGEPGQIAYMAQSDLLFPWLDVTRNVTLGARLRSESPDTDRARRLIERVGLADHANKKPSELSGGMRQRTALARTLMEDSELVLLDEPFSALDARTRAEMQELAFEVLQDKTVLLVTHDPGECARLASRIYLMGGTGLSEQPAPPDPAIRGIDDPAMLSAQAALLKRLREAT